MNESPHPEMDILNATLELPIDQRAAYLTQVCAGDAGLRARVEELLRAHGEADDFLEAPAARDLKRTMRLELSPSEKPGDKIGRYKLLQQIGEGGCGVVYMAEQEEPVRRRVALKVIKLGMDTKQVIVRFDAERQALALMDHPNIAKVFDAGATETGRPYFVMELVRGIKITEFCDENNVSTADRLKLFIQVCHAIQHAHQKGVIHRDIKPSNILVTINDGMPVPKVIDFGIAKATAGRLTDQTLFTAFDQFIGTPAYMSPEQAVMTSLDIDTRSDIYSLGVLLYELLVGCTPFDQKELLAAGLDEMRRTIREKEPPRPSTRLSSMLGEELTTTAKCRCTEPPKLLHLVRGDLDWIVMKCLEKERARRYETANGLAADLQRHLSNEPVIARPPSKVYRLQKNFRRNKLAFATAAAIVAALVVGLVIALWQYRGKSRAFDRAVLAEREQARLRIRAGEEADKSRQVAQFLRDMLKGVAPGVARGRDVTVLREVLDATAEHVGQGFTNQPGVEAELRSTMGEVYLALGQFEKAEAMQREALRLLLTLPGEDQLDVANALNNLGATLIERGQYGDAEKFLRESLTLRTKLVGEDSPAAAESTLNLAAVYAKQGRLVESETTYKDAVSRFRHLGGDGQAKLPKALGGLGIVLLQMGQLREAETNLLQALDLQTQATGPDSVETLNIQNALGNLYSSARRAEDAERAFRAALAAAKKYHGEEHPMVARAICNLAYVLRGRGRLEEAEQHLRSAVTMQKKLLGTNHVDLASSLGNLANVLRDQNKPDAAEETLREAIRIQEASVGKNHQDTIASMLNLATLSYNRGEIDQAVATLRDAAARLQSTGVTNGARLLPVVLCNLSAMLDAQGHYQEAETTAKEGIEVCHKSLGDEHPALPDAYLNLGLALEHQARRDEAEQIYIQAIAKLSGTARGSNQPTLAHLLHNLASLLKQVGNFDDAEARYQEAIVVWKRTLGDKNPGLARSLQGLATLLLDRDRYSEAEAAQLEAVAILRKQANPRTAEAIWTLAHIYECQKKWAESERLYAEAITMKRSLHPADNQKQANDAALATMLLHLTEVRIVQGKYVEAEAAARDHLSLRESQSPDSWQMDDARSLLGAALLGQQKYAEAEPFLISSCDSLIRRQKDVPASDRRRIERAINRLATLYEQTARPEQATATRQRLKELDQDGK